MAEVTVNQIIFRLSRQLTGSFTFSECLKFLLKGFELRVHSEPPAFNQRQPDIQAADVPQHGFISTAELCGFAIMIIAATAFVLQISV